MEQQPSKKTRVLEMLETDVNKKQEIIEMFKEIIHRQFINLFLAMICAIGIAAIILFFIMKPSKVDSVLQEKSAPKIDKLKTLK